MILSSSTFTIFSDLSSFYIHPCRTFFRAKILFKKEKIEIVGLFKNITGKKKDTINMKKNKQKNIKHAAG